MAEEVGPPPEREPGESLIDYAKRRAIHFGYEVKPTTTADIAREAVADDRFADLIPDPGELSAKSEEQFEMDSVIDAVDIVQAYNKWCGKMHVDPGKKRENIMVSCPIPGHADAEPSAAINLDKNVGMCYRCEQGWDQHDLAAWHFGFNVPGYKSKEDFPELRRKMAEDLGYRVMTAGKDEWLVKVGPTPAETPATAPTIADIPEALKKEAVESLEPVVEVSFEFATTPSLDWRAFPIAEGTFLDIWMNMMSESYEPEEYYFFGGLMALASACGNKVSYVDRPPVRPNLMTCMVGTTGAGKSIAISYIEKLIGEAMPFTEVGAGVRMIGSTGSGEALVDEFVYSFTEVDGDSTRTVDVPVNGFVKDNEMAALMKRIGRNGNTSREIIMDLYDRELPVRLSSRGHGSVEAKNHFFQLVSSTQPGSLRRLLSDADAAAGFLNRWAYVFGDAKYRPAIGVEEIDLTPAVESLRLVRAWGSAGRQIRWHDADARVMFEDFYKVRVYPLTLQEDAWMVARMPLLAKKLLLLLAVNDRLTTVTKDHVITLMAMWPYLLQCYGVVEAEVGVSDMELCMQKVEGYMMKRSGETVTIRELAKNSAAKKFPRELIIRCVQLMASAGLIIEVPREKGDRVTRYMWTPDMDSASYTM